MATSSLPTPSTMSPPSSGPGTDDASTSQSRRHRAAWLGAGGVVLLGLLAGWGGFAILGNQTDTQVATLEDMVIPDGWTTVVAPSGDFAFATPPDWIVVFNSDELARGLALYPGPGVTRELGGWWWSVDDASGSSLDARVVGVSGAEREADLRTEVEAAALGTPRDLESGERTVVRNEGFRHPLGFAGRYAKTCWIGPSPGNCAAAMGVSNGHTVVVAQVQNSGDAEFGVDDLKDVARSIVILRYPEDPTGL